MLVQKVLKWMAPIDTETEDKNDPIPNTLEYQQPSPNAKAFSTTSTEATSLLTYGTEFDKQNFGDFDLADGDIRSTVSLKSDSLDRKAEASNESFVSFKSDFGDRRVGSSCSVVASLTDIGVIDSEALKNVAEEHCQIPAGAGDGAGKPGSEQVSLSPRHVLKKSCSTQTEKKNSKRHHDVKAKAVHPLKEAPAVLTADASCESNHDSSDPKVIFQKLDPDVSREPIGPKHEKLDKLRLQKDPEPFEGVYGELAVLGCNGQPPDSLVGQMESRFRLTRRPRANGVKEAYSFVSSHRRPVPSADGKLSVFYRLSPGRSVVVEYARDAATDMFQVGRFEAPPVDFRVQDVRGARNGVSRFACRIVVRRDAPREARVFAAAFDPSGNIFLGEGAQTCVRDGKMDGFTTNGVLLMHPATMQWREVSVCGHLYPLRSPAVDLRKRPRLTTESNVLQDGSLIDLCGVTLVWRTPEALRTSAPSRAALARLERELESWAPEYEIPAALGRRPGRPVVFQSCGHVVNLLGSEKVEPLESWTCPLCRCIGPLSKLELGLEPCFFADCGFPTHAFRPCGHAASLKTVLRWAAVKIPEHRTFQEGLCPFCGVKLNFIAKYVELKCPE